MNEYKKILRFFGFRVDLAAAFGDYEVYKNPFMEEDDVSVYELPIDAIIISADEKIWIYKTGNQIRSLWFGDMSEFYLLDDGEE